MVVLGRDVCLERIQLAEAKVEQLG
jgi:hypothetical protein